MRYHNITKDDMLNGEGLRVVLWVAGCDHHCKNCQNPITWDINGGIEFDDDAKNELFEILSKPYISGITFSGGDPLHKQNREPVLELAKYISENFKDKNIWLYTGYLWNDIKNIENIKYIDTLVDGEFIESFKDTKAEWIGSTNQRIINVKKSLETGEIVLH
jgi:anaerobic ribonucleoside-triphosphate reductase activating protein